MRKVDAVVDDDDLLVGHAPVPEVGGRALRHRHDRDSSEGPRDGTFEDPGQGGHRQGGLLKGRGAEEVMHDENHRDAGPEGHEEWHLVQVLHHHVVATQSVMTPCEGGHVEAEGVASPDPVHADPVDDLECGGPREAGGQKCDLVAPGREATEDLVEVGLGTPGLGVLPVQPVDDEDPQEQVSLPLRFVLLHGSRMLVEGVQDSVHEPGGVPAPVGLGQMDPLLDGDFRGNVPEEE